MAAPTKFASYGGDIVASSEMAIFNFDMSRFYAKVVDDFADAARPREEIGVGYPAGANCVLERRRHALLAEHFLERCRPVFPRENEIRHRQRPAPPLPQSSIRKPLSAI